MPVPSKILHPLLSRPGASQRKRTANAFALQSDYAPIDGRTLADMLDFIHRYARQVVFQEYKKEEQGNGYIELSDWLHFFERSLPFQLVHFNKMNLKTLEADFLRLSNILNEEPNEENLGLLHHFLYNELLVPIQQLHTITAQFPFAFNTFLEATMRGLIASSLKQYIMLANSSKKYFCIEKPDFFAFTNTPWDLQIDDIYATNESLTRLPGGRTAVIQWLNEQLSAIFYQILGGIRQIVLAIPDYLGQSLEILGGRHEPHIGLLFAFLSLFKYFQNDLNQLTQEHLDFFYKHVLQIRPKDLVPDKAHLVFEIGQHRNSYSIPKGTFFKDGKDARNADILFGLDEEIVIDKAKIKDLKTLYLNQVKGKIAGSASEQFVEGLYIAPKANTADGQEIAFEETQSKNWATLGAKPSKYIAPGQRVLQNHPYGRIGFVLASPVLWLNEGKREIKISIECSLEEQMDLLTSCFDNLQNPFHEPYYWLTEDSLKKILSNEVIIEEIKAYFQNLFIIQTPYPIGYQYRLIEILSHIYNQACRPLSDRSFLLQVQLLEGFLDSNEGEVCFLSKAKFDAVENLSETFEEFKPVIQGFFDGYGEYRFLDLQTLLQLVDNRYNEIIFQLKKDKNLSPDDLKQKETVLKEDQTKDKETLNTQLSFTKASSIFKVSLTSDKGWIEPRCVITTFNRNATEKKITFDILVGLEPEAPPVSFYDKSVHKEEYILDQNHPLIKIELDPEIKIACPNELFGDSDCCLEKGEANAEVMISLYHFFRHLMVQDARIDIVACGIRNVIAQNDESVQDINSAIHPFGLRPEIIDSSIISQLDTVNENANLLGSSFYLGSKEILFKKWDKIRVNTDWNNKPSNFNDYYAAYLKRESTPCGVQYGICEEEFKIATFELEDGEWKINDSEEDGLLFHRTSSNFIECSSTDIYSWEIENQHEVRFIDFDQPLDIVQNARNGFLKFTLKDQAFLHKDYPFILARQMIAYSILDQGKKLTDAVYVDESRRSVISAIIDFAQDTSELTLADLIDKAKMEAEEIKNCIISICDKIIKENIDEEIDNGLIRQAMLNAVETIAGDYKTYVSELETMLINIVEEEGGSGKEAKKSAQNASNIVDALDAEVNPSTIADAERESLDAVTDVNTFFADVDSVRISLKDKLEGEGDETIEMVGVTAAKEINAALDKLKGDPPDPPDLTDTEGKSTANIATITKIKDRISDSNISDFLASRALQALIPNEPWTPTLKKLLLDYTAHADKDDITLIHLYPYQNTSRTENIELGPTLLPTFTDEGTLFIGLENLRPGATLQLLFQLAEATADSESFRAEVEWAYLTGNRWLPLRKGFEILSDATEGLTTSGIVSISVPRAISNQGNTIMPPFEDKPLFWLKVSAADHVESVAETIGVHAQAALANYAPTLNNDPNRVGKVVEPGKIAKPAQPDFNIKKVNQPYESFGGRLQEVEGHLYTRISEQLRHKGRSVELFDFEHLVLEAFPEIFKCKCISHTLGLSANDFRRDLEVAPGFIVLAVVPDLTKLKPGDLMEPKASLSLLAKIKTFIQQRVSAFARIRVMNPRFEKIKVDVKVRLKKGRDIPFYTQQLKTDLQQFLAPWHLGDASKITFGQHIMYADVLHFIEKLPYIDFISDLKLYGEEDLVNQVQIVVPRTARSVLTGGEICIEVDMEDCSERGSYATADKEICLEALDEFVQTPVAFASRFKK